MNQKSSATAKELRPQILEFCRHIAGSAQITAVSLIGNNAEGKPNLKATLETIMVVRDFQPRLLSYVKIVGGRNMVFLAVDQWIFERDVDRGFLGEALAGKLIFAHIALCGADYLRKQEVTLKRRLILELLENLAFSYPELSHHLHIKPEFFMYEVVANRVRFFPPLAYGLSSFMNGKKVESDLGGYVEALKQLEKENKIVLSDGYVMIAKKFVTQSQNPKVRFTNLSKNAPRTLFTSFFSTFPQLLNFFSQNTDALQKFQVKRNADLAGRLVDPQKYLFVPTSKGLVSLADRINIGTYARKILLNGENAKIEYKPVGGVLNDVYLIKAYPNAGEKKVLVKRFKDWSGFKWFPLSLWSFGARSFAVLGRSRLARECTISEFLRCEGFNVPKILHISHKERLVFMEYIEGENLSNAIKRIASAKGSKQVEGDLAKIESVGKIFAQVHSHNVTLGDTKPENVIVASDGKIYLLDFEQASHDGDRAWDIAVFLYYSGHYLQPLNSAGEAEAIAGAFISGYLKGNGDVNTVKKAGNSKYTRIFSVFTMPSVILAMSSFCKKGGAAR